MEENITKIINSEDSAYELLNQALAEANLDPKLQVVFKDWPTITIKFEGEEFQGGLPSRMLESFSSLQTIIYRVYCLEKYGHTDIRSLNADEKERLEFIIFPSDGSTNVVIKLAEVFKEIVRASNMTGKQVAVTVISIGFLITTSYSWTQWLNHKREIHNSKNIQVLSQEETERLKIVTSALALAPANIQEDIDNFRGSLARKLKPEDKIYIGDATTPLTTGAEAAEIIPVVRERAVDARVDGEFMISEVKAPKTADDPFIIFVARLEDDLQLRVEAEPGNLTTSQIAILKEGTFDRKKVLMSINAKKLGDRYTKANLYSLAWPEDN